MDDFILLMHDDGAAPRSDAWPGYFAMLRDRGVFAGGSAIGAGKAFRKAGTPGQPSERLSGFIRVRAASLADAEALLIGNPVFEAGGTVEICALPRD